MADALYPAALWRKRNGLPPRHNHRPRPRRFVRPPGPDDMVCAGPFFGLLSAPSVIPNPHPPPQPIVEDIDYDYNNGNMYGQSTSQIVVVDMIKCGHMQIEYNIIFKIYRKKYFILKSDSKLYYFNSPNDTHKKEDGIICLKHVTAIRKVNNQIIEMRVTNKENIFTADTTIWRLKCDSINERNEWFECIRMNVSKIKKASYIERKQLLQNSNNNNLNDEWCIVEKKDAIEEEHKSKEIIPSAPEQPGMNGFDHSENNDHPVPSAPFAPGYVEEKQDEEYGDEGKVTPSHGQHYYV